MLGGRDKFQEYEGFSQEASESVKTLLNFAKVGVLKAGIIRRGKNKHFYW